ncbi:MAG: penicillin-binding protein 2 [Endomicrobium sp.]|jgi:cell division protein FtsI (penicillin-binding protein 3)|nr:penicillin-binding protein 2 [Endomicrobium sp.]
MKRIDRKILLAFVILVFFFVLLIKLIFIQIFLHTKINATVKKMISSEAIEIAKRGDILDSKGNILASSIKKYNMFLDPKIIKDFYKLKNVLSKNGIKIKEKNLSEFGKTSYVQIAFNVDPKSVDKIKNEKLKGVGFESKYTRQYPEGKLLAHILGIVGYNGSGLAGIEKSYNKALSGSNVVTKNRRDGCGRIIRDKFVDKTKISGQNIKLSIDRTIQFIAEQELRKTFDKYKAKKAICIVQEPKTGNILAMVSLPDFDSSIKIKDIGILKNSAISDIYEPGSTFKIVTVSAALEEKIIKPSDVFYLENGKYKIANHTIKDNHRIGGCVSLSKAVEQSSNIAMVKIAQRLGKENFYKYIRKFGFYSLTGIDLPGEAKGLLKDIEKWDILSLPTISFGQGIGVTAIQMINVFSAIANNGILLKPSVQYDAKMLENTCKHKEIRRLISVETAQTVKKLLKNAVDFGTGKSAKISGYTVGGKTGTAQKFDSTAKTYSPKYYTASFCGMIPAMNPEIVILVIIDEPKGANYYASSVASPVFANIAKKTVHYLNIKKDDKN